MRLLNVRSFELEEFFEDDTPHFAILSHTWSTEEISFDEWQTIRSYEKTQRSDRGGDKSKRDLYAEQLQAKADAIYKKLGYKKIVRCCGEAQRRGQSHVWVDTCCIDKTSSAELTEAINSMYGWYQEAQFCFAYLSDVPSASQLVAFEQSRWFTRGWTLQELLAPRNLLFFDADWRLMFGKRDEETLLERITGISKSYLIHENSVTDATISMRMSWAANRRTTRKEDMAYCLLGIFGVNMPMLYGEGGRAFIRLQEEIMKQSTDQTILAWALALDSRKSWPQALPILLTVHYFAVTRDIVLTLHFKAQTKDCTSPCSSTDLNLAKIFYTRLSSVLVPTLRLSWPFLL